MLRQGEGLKFKRKETSQQTGCARVPLEQETSRHGEGIKDTKEAEENVESRDPRQRLIVKEKKDLMLER
jgi:hypothetical protein